MEAILAEYFIPFLIHLNRNQRVSWGRRVIEPRQVNDKNQGKVLIQYSNVSRKANAEEHSDFQANGLSRTPIVPGARFLAGRKIFFQEHVKERLVTTIPYTSINYIIFSYRRGDVFAYNSPSNIGSTNSTVAVLGYIQSSETLQMRAIHQKWMNGELSWKVMVGGLCGSEEFNREILDPLPGWTRVVALGELRLNNAGRLKVFV